MKAYSHLVSLFLAVLMLTFGTASTPTYAAEPELKAAVGTNVQYYLSLPDGWTSSNSWPIVVTVDGSGHHYLDNCQRFTKARGGRSFIIVTPCVSSNGNDPNDEQGILTIVKEVQQAYHGQPKFFITGFSAGGHVAWQIIFGHPELLAGAALAAGNFLGRGVDTVSNAPERVNLPIQEFQGDKDPYVVRLTEQWNSAEQLARAHGYQNLSRTLIPGAMHTRHQAQILDFFSSILASSARTP